MSISVEVEVSDLASDFSYEPHEFLELLCAVFSRSNYAAMAENGYDGTSEHDKLPQQLRDLADALEAESNKAG